MAGQPPVAQAPVAAVAPSVIAPTAPSPVAARVQLSTAVQAAVLPPKQSAWADYETVFTNAKAGMDNVDKDRVKQVVYEMSKGSRFFDNETRKESATKERVERLKQKAAKITPEERAGFQKAADKKVVELESTRDLSRTWMHVDMDAFYASVEELHDPTLANKPMAVGGMGMICTANYEARKYGVRAAMPGFIGKRLCPELVFVKPDFQKYTAASKEVQEVLREYDPNFIARSLDEAYLDLTQVSLDRNMSASEVAEEIRTKVQQKTALTCSAGVAPNRLLAKVCSDINKPNGQFTLPNERAAVMTFITSLPTRKVTGIGKVGERVLREVLGIVKCGELLEQRAMIFALFSSIAFDDYMAVGLGIGGTEAPKEEHRKSLSTERTFNTISRDADLISKLHEIANSLANDMAREGLHAKTLTLKLKTSGFEVRSRAVSLPTFISTADEILPPALRLLKAEMPISIRLMGLRFSHFREEIAFHNDPGQKTLTSFLQSALAQPSERTNSAKTATESNVERGPKSDFSLQPATAASAQEDVGSGPSSATAQRTMSAYLRASVATAQYINGPDQSGRLTETNGEAIPSRARGKKDGKIKPLLEKLHKPNQEVECFRCTFSNWCEARTCRMCGEQLGEQKDKHSPFEDKEEARTDEKRRSYEKDQEREVADRDRRERRESEGEMLFDPSLQQWLGETKTQKATLGEHRTEGNLQRADLQEGDLGWKQNGYAQTDSSALMDQGVRLDSDSDGEFDALRNWSEEEDLETDMHVDEGRANGKPESIQRLAVLNSERRSTEGEEIRVRGKRLVGLDREPLANGHVALTASKRAKTSETLKHEAFSQQGPDGRQSNEIYTGAGNDSFERIKERTATERSFDNGETPCTIEQKVTGQRHQRLVEDEASAGNIARREGTAEQDLVVEASVEQTTTDSSVSQSEIKAGTSIDINTPDRIGPETSSLADAKASKPFVKCAICGQEVPTSGLQRQEHDDYHVALQLYREEGGRLPALTHRVADKHRPTTTKSNDHRKPRNQGRSFKGTLDTFLTRKA